MNEYDEKILRGLETVLHVKEMWKDLFPKEKDDKTIDTFLQIFLTGFLLSSMSIYGKMSRNSYLKLVQQEDISIYDRIKVAIAYIKAKG